MLRRLVNTLLLIVSVAALLNAKVIRVEVVSQNDVLGGKAFGATGAYQRITGRIYFSVPVANPHNQRVVDLANSVNLKKGEVEFSADFVAIRPKDAQKGNGSMILEIPNRGYGRITGLVDGGDWNVANDAGDAWLLRNGFTIVTLGWQWDATGENVLRLNAPIARENGRPSQACYEATTPLGNSCPRFRWATSLSETRLAGVNTRLQNLMIPGMFSRFATRGMRRAL